MTVRIILTKIKPFVQIDPVIQPNFDVTALNVSKIVGNATGSMTVKIIQMSRVVRTVSYLRLTLNRHLIINITLTHEYV